MRRRRPAIAAALAAILSAAAPPPAPAPAPAPAAPAPAADEVVAREGDITLTVADVRALVARLDAATRAKLDQNPTALAELVRERLVQLRLIATALAMQWDQKPEVAERIAQARDAIIAETFLDSVSRPDADYPSEADIAAAYEANKARFVVPRQYHLMQVFIAVPADAPAHANEEAQKKLREIQQQAQRPKADFAALARATARDPKAPGADGDLGWTREDQLVPAVKAAVAGLAEGGVSDPVRTPDGWHLIKLVETKPAATAPLSDVRGPIADALRRARASENARRYIDQMQRDTPAQLNEIGLSRALAP